MEDQRPEVFERIPWENLRLDRPDRRWIAYMAAGMIAVGALAYSFASSRAPSVEPLGSVPAMASAATTSPVEPVSPTLGPQPPVTIVSEADLMATQPHRLEMEAVAHAEWFAADFFTIDGADSLASGGLERPLAPDGTRVFVDWVRAVGVEETGAASYRVEVMVRSMTAADGTAYRRDPLRLIAVSVEYGEAGPTVSSYPELLAVDWVAGVKPDLVEPPADVSAQASDLTGATSVLGGRPNAGGWEVVVMVPSAGGVAWPLTVTVP